MTTSLSIERKLLSAILGLSLLTLAVTATAQSPGPVAVTLVAQKVVTQADGKEVTRPAESAFPGEVVQYDAHYRNTSEKGVRDLQPVLPIPAGLEYLPGSGKPDPNHASVDGRKFFPYPLTRSVRQPDGTMRQEPVPWTEYRALRWSIGDLAAGAKVTVTARARLSLNPVASR